MEVEGFETFGEASSGGGYNWRVFGVWLKDGEFWWASDAGCSCYYQWYDSNFPADFEGHGTAHDAIKALMDWKDSAAEAEPLLNRLLGYRE